MWRRHLSAATFAPPPPQTRPRPDASHPRDGPRAQAFAGHAEDHWINVVTSRAGGAFAEVRRPPAQREPARRAARGRCESARARACAPENSLRARRRRPRRQAARVAAEKRREEDEALAAKVAAEEKAKEDEVAARAAKPQIDAILADRDTSKQQKILAINRLDLPVTVKQRAMQAAQTGKEFKIQDYYTFLGGLIAFSIAASMTSSTSSLWPRISCKDPHEPLSGCRGDGSFTPSAGRRQCFEFSSPSRSS